MNPETPLNIRHFGAGPQSVLALHCTIAHAGAWRGLGTALDGRAQITAPDMYCHGQSPDWDGEGDFLVRMIEATLPLLNDPVHLVGHSFGAVLALALACRAPDKVRSLTMVETVFFAVAVQDAPEIVAAQDAVEAETSRAFAAQDWPLAARLFNRAWSGTGPRWPEMPERMRAAMTRGVRIVPASAPGLRDDSQGLIAQLPGLTMPVLLMRGDASPEVMRVVHAGLARRMPTARELVVPGAGHMLPITHPAPVAEAMADMIAATA